MKKLKAIKPIDQELANVMNYIRNSWDNKNTTVITGQRVAKIRMTLPKQ